MDNETYQNVQKTLSEQINLRVKRRYTNIDGGLSNDDIKILTLCVQTLINLECHKKDGGVDSAPVAKDQPAPKL